MNSAITFAQFDAVLAELGFKSNVVPGSHVNYEHAKSGAVLMIRLHKPTDVVPNYVLISTRVQLDGQGVIEANNFEAMLSAVAA